MADHVDPPEELLEADEAELAAARALARALDEELFPASSSGADALDVEAVTKIRAAAGNTLPLGELRARGIARAAVEAAGRAKPRAAAPARRRWPWMAVSAAAVLVFAVGLTLATRSTEKVPDHLYARRAGMLVPGPFPTSQTPAQRLDLVTNDRLVAFRERRIRAVSRGRR